MSEEETETPVLKDFIVFCGYMVCGNGGYELVIKAPETPTIVCGVCEHPITDISSPA